MERLTDRENQHYVDVEKNMMIESDQGGMNKLPCDDEKWYEHEVKTDKLPDKNEYYYPPKEYYENLADELEQDENDEWY